MKSLAAKFLAASLLGALMAWTPTPAFAYELRGAGCGGNGQGCRVYCDNGQLAGEMYFNNGVWTDGVKWDRSREATARKIVAANGSACT